MTIQCVVIGEHGNMGSIIKTMLKQHDQYQLLPSIELDKNMDNIDAILMFLSRLPSDAIIIDFSHCEISHILLKYAKRYPIKLIIGTSNIDPNKLVEVKTNRIATLSYVPNFSQGAYYISDWLDQLTNMTKPQDIAIIDHHGRHKTDRPSSTATVLAQQCEAQWEDTPIEIASIRYGKGVSKHQCYLSFPGEEIKLSVTVFHRQAFLRNIKRTIDFIYDAEPGSYTLHDVLRRKPC
jgi:dihydrodipicolinate reductase